MSGFIEWLEGLNEKDTKVRAVLRRSLAFDPGRFTPAYPYVEPFLKARHRRRVVARSRLAETKELVVGGFAMIGDQRAKRFHSGAVGFDDRRAGERRDALG